VGARRPVLNSIAMSVVILLALVGCNSGSKGRAGTGEIIRVPQEVPTVQGAVNKAKPGDIVLVSPGTYHEKVLIERDRITLRGTDRNTVIFDGQYKLQNAIEVAADGVVVENLTTHSYNGNGVFFNGVYSPTGVDKSKVYGTGENALKGYRASYITAYNNGLYGIYAFAARGGQIDHSYASGHPDSGFYIGQCKPCDVLITDVIAENNSIGYFGTNASEGIYVVNSIFRGNRLGVIPNTQKLEKLAPQVQTVIAGNVIANNGNLAAPPHPRGTIGNGVVIGGGTKDVIAKNRIVGNPGGGVVVTDLDDFAPESNTVEGNVLENNGIDLVYAPIKGVTAGHCFRANTFTTSSPDAIETLVACGAPAATALKAPPFKGLVEAKGPSYKTVTAPGPQPSMPDAATAPAKPATETTPTFDLNSVTVPAA
jgi:hypothetical protein